MKKPTSKDFYFLFFVVFMCLWWVFVALPARETALDADNRAWASDQAEARRQNTTPGVVEAQRNERIAAFHACVTARQARYARELGYTYMDSLSPSLRYCETNVNNPAR